MQISRMTCRSIVIAIAVSAIGAAHAQDLSDFSDWWEVQEGFALSIDARGFEFPTAIAFVPNPGPAPDDPLYFVTEIRGAVKVVTNDRTVHTFAEGFFTLQPQHELPSTEGEIGMAGICLEPSRGYVYVSFAYQDESGLLRNNIVRFDANPVRSASGPPPGAS